MAKDDVELDSADEIYYILLMLEQDKRRTVHQA